jgi:hypothetical protein
MFHSVLAHFFHNEVFHWLASNNSTTLLTALRVNGLLR